ncbi:MAG: ATP-binding cassette domain-containing protein, partial [Acidimicrobiia bacterium]|nr:ATP-binding cassette domain-containing protein [Acidimicrobiia bacterium]
MNDTATPLLEVQDLYAGYLDFDILHGVNLVVRPGEVVCVIGPNGAGKSTVFRAIYGLIKVRLGHV